MLENFIKSTYIKIGQTTQEVFDNVKKDALYSNKYLGSGETMHIWALPKTGFASHYNDGQIVTVQIIIKDGVVVDGSHFVKKDGKEVEYILKNGVRDLNEKKNRDDEIIKSLGVTKPEIVNKERFDCSLGEYKEYLLDTIQYCDENKPFAFISYSSKDYENVWENVINLQLKGYNLWIDKNMKETEDSWEFSAKKALDNPNCKLVIFYLSKTSITSSPCLKELKYREKNNIPYIVIETRSMGSFGDFISSVDTTNKVFKEMSPHFVPSSRIRIKQPSSIELKQNYYKKIENNLNEHNIKELSEDELYSKAVKSFGEFNGEHKAIALLEYCYSQNYFPAILLRTFIQEKPVFKDFFTDNQNIKLKKLQKISKLDEWITTAKEYEKKRRVEQAAAFYSAYALVNNNKESYKKAARLWGMCNSETKGALFYSCQEETYMLGYKDGWIIEAKDIYNGMFDLAPLTFFGVQKFSVTNSNTTGAVDAWDVSPDAINNGNKTPTIKFGVSNEYENLKQILLNYTENYQSNSLWDTDAGYYAVQLAIWGRIKNYDPINLTIFEREDIAKNIRSLASALYNDHTEIVYDIAFKYDGSTDVQESYNLSGDEADSEVTLFYDNGDWYYRSKPMSITNAGYAGNISFTVKVNEDGEGYITDSTKDNSHKYKTLTFDDINYQNVFYVVYPAEMAAGETSITVTAKYNCIDAMLWDYSLNNDNKGQKIINAYVDKKEKQFTVKFTRDEVKKPKKYTGKIRLDVNGIGVIGYTTSNINNETLYTLQEGEKGLDGAYIAFYKVLTTDVGATLIGDGAYRTKGPTMTASNIPLEVGADGYADILVCETEAPDGYEVFDGKPTTFTKGSTYIGAKYGFNTLNADENNVITREITLINKSKKFSVNITKKDQNETLLSDYNFGLYTTKEIKVSNKETIPAGSLVAYVTTDNNGSATIDTYLPASQNFVLKEIGSGDSDATITIDEETIHGTKITLDVLNRATVEGYAFAVTFTKER